MPNSSFVEIKDFLKEYALTRTSCYGISNILKSKHFIGKVFWSLVFILCTVLLSWLSIELLINFWRFEVVTKIEYHPEVLSRFPGVTICNQNPFITEYSNQVLFDFFNQSAIKDKYFDQNNQIKWEYLSEIRFLIKIFASNLTDDKKKMLGYKTNETLLQCSFNLERCNWSEITWFYEFEHGSCFVFNSLIGDDSSKLKNVSLTGKTYGLHLELFVGFNQTKYNSIFDQGVSIIIFNQTKGYYSSKIDVSVGSQTNIKIERLFINKKESPYSECRNSEDLIDNSKYQNILNNFGIEYGQPVCNLICFQDFLTKNCKCYIPPLFDPTDSRPCNFSIHFDLECALNSHKKFFGSSVEINKCKEYCPIECKSIKYSITSSQIDYPSKGLANIIKLDPRIQEKFNYSSNISFDDLKNSLVSLNIYYDELGFSSINEKATYDNIVILTLLVSNMGVFLGLSFISIFEIFEIFVITIKMIFDKIKIKNRNT